MSNSGIGSDSKAFLSACLRQMELRQAGGDEATVRSIAEMSDSEILKKWLWQTTLYGAPLFFVIGPILLFLLGLIFTPFILEIFWFMDKLAMIGVLAVFGFAVYFTFVAKPD